MMMVDDSSTTVLAIHTQADEAAEALLAELEAEEERKARKQQQKKKKKKKDKNKKAATTTEATDAKVAALEQATGKLLAFAFDGNGDEEADEVNPGATTATTDAGEDRKVRFCFNCRVYVVDGMSGLHGLKDAPRFAQHTQNQPTQYNIQIPAPTAAGATPPKKKRERKKNPKPPTTTTTSIPESEGRGQQGKGSGKAAVATAAAATAAGAPPGRAPPTAAGDCSAAAVAFLSSPAKAKAKAAAAQDPRELAFLLKRARREDKCPLSGALLTDPVIASDGITYDRAALHAFAAAEAAEDRPLLSPVTGQPIARVFFPNQNVKRLVETAVEELQAEWRRPGRR